MKQNRRIEMNPLYQQALFLHRSGNLHQAMELYRTLAKEFPRNPQLLSLLGTAEARRGDFAACIDLLGKSLKIDPNNPNTCNSRGNALLELGRFEEALRDYERAIRLKADFPEALNNRGTVLKELGRFDEALQSYERVLRLKPDYPEAHYNRGIVLQQLKRFDEALHCYDRALQLKPDYLKAHDNRGTVLKELQRPVEALESHDRAISLNRSYPEAHYNRGIVLQELKRFDEALQSYDRALGLRPGYRDAYINRGVVLQELKRFEDALQSYDHALQLNSADAEAYVNRGIALQSLRRLEEALQSYDRALQLKASYSEAHDNRGIALQELKRFDEALLSHDRAIQLHADHPDSYVNRGVALGELKRFDEALQSYDRARLLNHEAGFWMGDRFYLALGCCDWINFEASRDELLRGVAENRKVVVPFVSLLLTDSADIQRQAAQIWVTEKSASGGRSMLPVKYPRREKMRIGYFSADFHNHATMHLMAEMFEHHDRSKFEIYGFSFGPDSNDHWQERAESSFDSFFDVRFQSDREVAQTARELQLDIAVDLKGYTADARPDIFAGRAAPIQVNYLGFPGSMGAEFMDYIVADATIIPETERHYYTEKVVTLPHCYQVNCSHRHISSKNLTREELHLPQDGFVYCSFNNSNKITPTVFECWMRILRKVDGSVLWLFESNVLAKDNLCMEAKRLGVNAERLVFAESLPVEEHLNRIRHADLFLDTLPYNAHTTASDALRMGVPLLTRAGNSFAGRVAASLLKSLDLEGLITDAAESYERIAVELATDRERLRSIREKLIGKVHTSPLYDSERFTRNLEKAYDSMYERYQNDLAPGHIVVKP